MFCRDIKLNCQLSKDQIKRNCTWTYKEIYTTTIFVADVLVLQNIESVNVFINHYDSCH